MILRWILRRAVSIVPLQLEVALESPAIGVRPRAQKET